MKSEEGKKPAIKEKGETIRGTTQIEDIDNGAQMDTEGKKRGEGERLARQCTHTKVTRQEKKI